VVNNRSNVQSLEGPADAAASRLEPAVITEQLHQRAARSPDYAAENRALNALAQEMAEAPGNVIQKLVDMALELTGAGSAGLSVVESDGGEEVFRWRATAGAFAPYAGSTMPRDFYLCGAGFDHSAAQLLTDPVRFCPCFSELRPHIYEVLLVPFHCNGVRAGTVWVVAHTPAKRFDAEHARLVTSLSRFAAAAVQARSSTQALEAANRSLSAGVAERGRIEQYRQALSAEVERQARVFDTVLSSIVDFVYTFDRDGRFTYVNKALLDLWGLKLEQAVGKDFFDLKYPDDLAARLQRQIQQVIETKRGLSDETPYTSPSGEGGYYEYIFAPVFGADGSVEMVAGSTRDITARKKVEHELAEARRRSDSALIAGEVGMFEWDIIADRLYGDRNFERLFNIALDASGAAPLSAFLAAIHPDDQEFVSALVRQSIESGCDYEAEYRIMSGARERWVIARGKVERDGSGRAVRFPGVVLDITVQKRAERDRQVMSDEIERQARIYDTILSATDDFAYIFDRDGRFLYANRRLLEVWGKTLDQVIGRTCYDLAYPTWHADMHMREIRQVLETKRPIRGEVPFTGGSGISGVYDYIFTPVVGPDGEVEVIAGTTRDVTDRNRAAEERERLLRTLANERARLAAVIEQAPAFICTLRGPEHVFELANERYYEIVGKRDIIGKPVRDALPEVEGQGFFELLDQVYRTGRTFAGNELPMLLRRQADSGLEKRFMNFAYQALREADGSISGIFVHGVDVTEIVRSRDALRESEAQFRQLADAMPQMVWVTAPDGYHEYFNRRWYEFTGVPEGSTDGEGWSEMFHPDDRAQAWAAWRHSLASGEPYEIEYRLRHHTGQYRWTLGRAMPVRNERGQIARWFGTCTDIDTLRRLMDEREALLQSERSARAEAESANRAKDRFLAVLSHELRTPLTPVAMAATAMEMDPGLPFDFREDVAMIRRNVELETRLIDDLLDLSRVISGKLRLNRQRTHVHRLIGHVLETVGPELHEKQLKVDRQLAAARDLVHADPARLQQTLWNLLKNAAKFTPSGGRVCIRTRNEDDWVVIEVEDTGKGIAADVLPRIFNPFEQGDAEVTRTYGGIGLGLAIAKAVVDMHDGTIRANSDGVGEGAVFTVTLPLAQSDPAPSTGREESIDHQEQGIRLLLVEDHADTAKTLVRLLRLDGTEVQWASTVAAALELATSESFDLVVSDLGLPDGSGHELMRRLHREYALTGIAMSGYGMEEDIRQSREAGFVEHLVKPVAVPQLRDAIRRVANARSRGSVE
jgi:PAS domain S-box-containing protein